MADLKNIIIYFLFHIYMRPRYVILSFRVRISPVIYVSGFYFSSGCVIHTFVECFIWIFIIRRYFFLSYSSFFSFFFFIHLSSFIVFILNLVVSVCMYVRMHWIWNQVIIAHDVYKFVCVCVSSTFSLTPGWLIKKYTARAVCRRWR